MLHAARLKYRTQNIARHSPSGHHHTTLSGYSFATKARIDNRKNLLNRNISPTRPRNMVNFGPLAAEIGSLVWGTPANFNGFCVLTALRHSSSGRQLNFAALNRGRVAIMLSIGPGPHSSLEYCSVAWNPFTLKGINTLESVQLKFTKRLPGTKPLTYHQRLTKIELKSSRLSLSECAEI